MGMMRVSQCCCGCSLRTGTLIILWLGVLNGVYSVIQYSVAAFDSRSAFQFLEASMLTYQCITLVVVIYALVGVEKHRPSYMLPYIGMCVVSLVLMALSLLILWIGSIALRVRIMDALGFQRLVQTQQSEDSSNDVFYIHKTAEERGQDAYNAGVSLITFIFVIAFAISFYLFAVVYSYYKQMQEEDQGIYHPGNGIVYAAPSTQPGKNCVDQPPAYVQGTAGSLYPQQTVGYPQQNVGFTQPTVSVTQQHVGYPQQNVGYPQQFPVYPPVIDQK